MRAWDADHPKARLLARKQAAILDAARLQFLEKGFGETTMASVAAAAGVSVATLYRHAHSKEELFEAIVAGNHDPEEIAAGVAQLERMELPDALRAFGTGVAGMILSPQSVAMHRMVIAEAERFPHLGPLVFDALIGHAGDALVRFLGNRIGEERAAAVASDFVTAIVGARLLRALLGLPADETADALAARIDRAARDFGLVAR